MARVLNEKQQLFLLHLFGDEARGNAAKAKLLAGYSPDYSTAVLVKSLKEEIVDATRDFLSQNGPLAAISLVDTMMSPTQLGVRDKMAAAKDILDRVGVTKTEKIEVAGTGLFILPSKNPRTVADDDDAEDS